eukprot:GHVO01053140.1.p1 GENE.GHVO01053140.1~~GHVO01053140.1.p1  ORF type:complete len:486 (+),score=104.05 GHVO01053140.1:1432-2889(+)
MIMNRLPLTLSAALRQKREDESKASIGDTSTMHLARDGMKTVEDMVKVLQYYLGLGASAPSKSLDIARDIIDLSTYMGAYGSFNLPSVYLSYIDNLPTISTKYYGKQIASRVQDISLELVATIDRVDHNGTVLTSILQNEDMRSRAIDTLYARTKSLENSIHDCERAFTEHTHGGFERHSQQLLTHTDRLHSHGLEIRKLTGVINTHQILLNNHTSDLKELFADRGMGVNQYDVEGNVKTQDADSVNEISKVSEDIDDIKTTLLDLQTDMAEMKKTMNAHDLTIGAVEAHAQEMANIMNDQISREVVTRTANMATEMSRIISSHVSKDLEEFRYETRNHIATALQNNRALFSSLQRQLEDVVRYSGERPIHPELVSILGCAVQQSPITSPKPFPPMKLHMDHISPPEKCGIWDMNISIPPTPHVPTKCIIDVLGQSKHQPSRTIPDDILIESQIVSTYDHANSKKGVSVKKGFWNSLRCGRRNST